MAVEIAPENSLGLFVGLAIAAYTLPGVLGALVFGRALRGRPARALVLAHATLRAGCLTAIGLLSVVEALTPTALVVLLAFSSLMAAWGNAGQYTMLSALAGSEGRFAVNSLASAQTSLAFIIGPLVAGLLSGEIQIGMETIPGSKALAAGGKLRMLAVTSLRRNPALPDVPSVNESGVPGYEASTWNGIVAPAGVPQAIVSRLNAAINDALNTPTVRQRFAAIGAEPVNSTPDEFRDLIRRENAKWAEVIKRSGAKID